MSSQIDLLGAPDAGGERDPRDRYYTPPWCTEALVHYLGDTPIDHVWEPCAGQCYIASVLREHGITTTATDIYPHESLDDELDFLSPEMSHQSDWFDWIITNPPYRTAGDRTAASFVRQALKHSRNVAMLLRLSWLEGAGDRIDILREHPPTDLLVLPRVSFIGAPPGGGDTITSAWFIWAHDRLTGAQQITVYPPEIRSATYNAWHTLEQKRML